MSEGIDVSGCKYAENSIPVDCNIDTCFCYENNNCYYKQLKRLEQENQELGKIIGCKNGTIASLVQIRDELKQVNAKLKEAFRKAKEVILYCYDEEKPFAPCIDCKYYEECKMQPIDYVIRIIEEVLKDENE